MASTNLYTASLDKVANNPTVFKRSLPVSEINAAITKAATPRFPRLNAAAESLKTRILSYKNQQNAIKLATFLAAYPIVKLALSIIAHFTAGATIALPPVAAGLLIAAATLFLLTMIVKLVQHREAKKLDLAKFVGKEVAKFVAAPATSLYIIGKEIQYQVRTHSKPYKGTKVHSQ
jgi:hypothetical protein